MRLVCCLVLLLGGLQLTCALLVAAWNIKTFGRSKANLRRINQPIKAAILNYIAMVVRRYDIIVIQEVIDNGNTQTVAPALQTVVNQPGGPRYAFISSNPLGLIGRNYFERYVFFYRTTGTTVAYVDNYQYNNNNNVFARPPFIARFRSNAAAGIGVYEFALIPLHSRPDFARIEIDALDDVVFDVSNYPIWNNIPNILLLGDFNAGCRSVNVRNWGQNRLRPPPNGPSRYNWLIHDNAATNVASITGRRCPYDRIVATTAMVQYVVQQQTAPQAQPVYAEVYQFQQHIPLNGIPAPEQISDHFPVEVTLL